MPEDILSLAPPPADFRLHYGRSPEQFGDLRLCGKESLRGRLPSRARPILMNIHGGFWRNKYDLAHASHLCAALTQQGIATWNLEYRRVGDEGGGWPGTFRDIVDGYRYLAQISPRYELDAGRMVVMGHSAGGQLALCLGARESMRAISLAGVVDLHRAWELHLSHDAVAEFLGGTPAEVPDRYRDADPMQLEPGRAEQWLVHGTADDNVPVSFSRDYYARKNNKREQVHLLEIEDAGHFDVIDPRAPAWAKIEEVVLQMLTT